MKMSLRAAKFALIVFAVALPQYAQQSVRYSNTPDIRKLSQQFTESKNFSPWIFVPQNNVKSISGTDHPGFVTLQEAGKGEDIRGILKDPIKIDEFPLPWEFHMGLARTEAETGSNIGNYAIGLNLVLAFSDPSTWPKDRTQPPPGAHSFQLMDVHLKGPQITTGPLNYYAPATGVQSGDTKGHGGDPFGNPNQRPKRVAEVYLLYGRGDLDPSARGNWKIPYEWQGYPSAGAWDYSDGPASHSLCYRVRIISPTSVEVGFFGGLEGQPHLGWRMRTLDVSRWGKITGIWEIGPIFSTDRWIPDTLGHELALASDLPLAPPDASAHYMVDYAVFFGTGPKNLDHMSDDFDDPGFHAKWYHEGAALVDTYSHPGHLTVTLLPQGGAGWAMCPTNIGSTLTETSQFQPFPGFEYEIRFTPPEGKIPWNFYMSSITLWDAKGKPVGYGTMPYADPGAWQPGVQYLPEQRKHRFFNVDPYSQGPNKGLINVEFQPEVPESILAHRPLYMLVQMLDESHLRVGLKGNKGDPWYFSKVFDTTKAFGKIGKFNPHTCFTGSASTGTVRGAGIGNFPSYPQFLIDYVHYHWGLSTPK